MQIHEIILTLEQFAPPSLKESYDNVGLLTGDATWHCTGILISLDATEEVVLEAKARGCNLVISHHPIIFGGLKKITGSNYVEKAVIASIKNDIALYAIHTNLDNVKEGVNGRIADLLELRNRQIILPKTGLLRKLISFVPVDKIDIVRNALFATGAGHIGNYSECSFQAEGEGSFLAGQGANPYIGQQGRRHYEKESRLEVIFPSYLERVVISALKASHPYEEVAFDVVELQNQWDRVGSGIMGEVGEEMEELQFLGRLKELFRVPVVRHTELRNKKIRRIAVCGGAGSFLVNRALQLKADIYITGDIKYHEFFDANGQMVIADVGHFETEQFTVDLLYDILAEKFPTFAVFKTGVLTNPVNYYI